jgi:hypothetical protein
METFQLPTAADSEDRMFRPHIFEWHKRFSKRQGSMKNDDLSGHPHKPVTANTIKVQDVIQKDYRLGIQQ